MPQSFRAVPMKTGSLDVRTNGRRKESQEDYRNLRKSLCVGYANQLAERMMRHNGYRTLGFKPQLVQVRTVQKPRRLVLSCYMHLFLAEAFDFAS